MPAITCTSRHTSFSWSLAVEGRRHRSAILPHPSQERSKAGPVARQAISTAALDLIVYDIVDDNG
jgi:hypothetical protein